MRSTSFHIVNLGCKVNRVEADTLKAALLGSGAVIAPEETANLVIVNTCTVTGEAEKKARKAVRHALSANPAAQVIVTGCAAAIAPDSFASMSPRVRIVSKTDLSSLVAERPTAQVLRVGEGFNTRVGLKVQDGCDHACTYCIVHVARGKARSVEAGAVVSEARSYFGAGVREIILTGIDIGAYDDGAVRLPELASRLIAAADDAGPYEGYPPRIRISSIEPMSVDEGVVDLLGRSQGRVCRHLHLPLQSGSTRVLNEMNRPYTAEDFLELVMELRGRVPRIALSTDVIVGFPGETDEDFERTCALVEQAGFMRLHVFPYSRRAGTPAAERDDQVSDEVKRERAARLRTLGKSLADRDLKTRQGTEELCLAEGATALSESYHEVPAPPHARLGDLVPVAL